MSYAPLQVHSTTGEPYLRLPAPHDNIIITPPRSTDVEALVDMLNDPLIALKIESPPYPYRTEHAVWWLDTQMELSRKAMEEMKRGQEFLSECPVQSIREIQADGREVLIGEVKIARSNFSHILDEERAGRLRMENDAKAVGDSSIVWFIGDYLASSHHGKGIMSKAVTAMMDCASKVMNVHHLDVTANADNIASLRVFEKNGFTHFGTLVDCKKYAQSKGDGYYSISVMKWRR